MAVVRVLGSVEERTGGCSSPPLNKCSCGYGRSVRYLKDLKGTSSDTPSDALISQPKMEFPQMAHRVLLVLPPDSLTDVAKAALKPTLGRL